MVDLTDSLCPQTGAGESGKSTILKQMKILHANGFSLDERREIRPIIFSNLVVAFKIIIDEMSQLEIEYENRESEVSVKSCVFPGADLLSHSGLFDLPCYRS